MLGFAKRGPQQLARGSSGPLRNSISGALVTHDAHGKYAEAAINNRIFHCKTADAGVAPGTAVGTTAAFSLHNVKGSSVYVSVLAIGLGYVSGTLGAGLIAACTNVNLAEAVPTGTAIVSRPGLVGGAAPVGAVALTTATLAVAPNAVMALFTVGAALATTAAFPALQWIEIGGAIMLPAGGCMSLQGIAAAGTTPLVVLSVIYEEIDNV